jgi:hypothetical protein
MFYELDENGKFVCDAFETKGLQNWTKLAPPQPCVAPFLVGKRNKKTGEWVGEWQDVEPEIIE